MTETTERKITGLHVFGMFAAAFSVIIGVNVVLATQAVRTFPGLEVKNSYVASQSFDTDRAAQEALGWTVGATLDGGRLTLRIDDAVGAVVPTIEKATLGRATFTGQDRAPDFHHNGTAFIADLDNLEPGNWDLWIEARAANGTVFKQRMAVEIVK